MENDGVNVIFGQNAFFSGLTGTVPLQFKKFFLLPTLPVSTEHVAKELAFVFFFGFSQLVEFAG
jgi:hypothetical protein